MNYYFIIISFHTLFNIFLTASKISSIKIHPSFLQIGIFSSSVIFLYYVLYFFFQLCLLYFQRLFFNTCQKV